MRTATEERQTKETSIKVEVNLDGKGDYQIDTPINFLNHMLEAMSRHSLIDLKVKGKGDTEIDQHHTIEDLAIVLGKSLKSALGNKKGIQRAGFFLYPMDDALARVAVDISGRPYLQFDAQFKRRYCGDLDTDLIKHFFEAFSNSLGANLVITLEAGENDHHKLEAIFKGLAKSLKMACTIDPRMKDKVPSTKEKIDDL